MGEIADALQRAGKERPAAPFETPRARNRRERAHGSSPAEPTPGELQTILSESKSIAPPKVFPNPVLQDPVSLRGDGTEVASDPSKLSALDGKGVVYQQFLRVAFRLRDKAIERNARSIMVTSAEPFEGKTTVACNLATQLAKLDEDSRVLLVDLDLHRASVARSLGLPISCPIDAVIRGERPLDEAILGTDIEGLSILGLDRPAVSVDKLLASPRFRSLISDLIQRFDFVVIDSPPVLAVPDAQVILRCVDAGVLVTRAGQTPVRSIRRAVEHLPSEKLLGTIVNDSPESSAQNGYDGYGDYGDYGAYADASASDNAEKKATEKDPNG